MLNKVADGKTTIYTAAANVKAGSFVKIFGKTGVAVKDIDSGNKGVLDMEGGVYQFTATAAFDATSKGAAIYDAAAVTVSTGAGFTTSSASGAVLFGYLEEAVDNGTKTAKIRLA